ncbi:MAG: Flp pilus assembly complex ATPase component TadA [Elusimicrobia bacterium]|nr:Flp pilus assembly complex ATPase component TadA [Elusimicrobiota bacterium]
MAIQGLQRRKSAQDIFQDKKLLTAEQLKAALGESKKKGLPLQQVAVDLGFLSRVQVLRTLSEAWKVKAVDLQMLQPDPDVVKLVPETAARRHRAVPFAKEETVLFVAMAEPGDFFTTEDIHLRTGLEVLSYLALPEDVDHILDQAYGRGESDAFSKILASVEKQGEGAFGDGGLQLASEEVKADITEVDASAPEVEKMVNAVILGALSLKASDIHVEPFQDPAGKNSKLFVRYRVDGLLREAPFQVPWSFRNALIAKLKIMTNSMDITERRIPQSGRIQVIAQASPIEFRVEIIPSAHGESCVMRILDRKAVQVDIAKLGFAPDTLKTFLGLLRGVGGKKNFGLILVCGPTGSGKSTTLYAALNHINRPDLKILTAENPVEYNLDGIVQVPVNPDIRLGEEKRFDFALALRSFLRLDPDVIMVGEIRDRETAQVAMEASMTGHLVFSTIHTNDAPAAVTRLTEMGVPAFMVASTVKAVLAQRLVRRVCGACREAVSVTVEELAVFQEHGVPPPSGNTLLKGKGCDICLQSGFKGRAGIHELLVLTDALREVALREKGSESLAKAAARQGMRNLIQDGLMKASEGLTTVREVLGGGE